MQLSARWAFNRPWWGHTAHFSLFAGRLKVGVSFGWARKGADDE